ncbi:MULTISPECIES: hypothetical protein [Flavobacterium]|uniref:hypothetical protein n=1 Tax=Flavobacterium TaxID=237 RepID=UPI001183A7C5|nr:MULTISPECIES: hypothetical protein [Flavobacterium]MCR4029306.1 hypothetical protein [Flavobacterium panacis]
MNTFEDNFERLRYYNSSLKRHFAELLLEEITNSNYFQTDSLANMDRLNFIDEFVPIYLDIKNQKFKSILKIEDLYNKYYEKSSDFSTIIKLIFTNLFDLFYKTEFPWQKELDIEPIDRFITIHDFIPFDFPENIDDLKRERYSRLPDEKFNDVKQEFRSLLSERNNPNILSVGISSCYANVTLPKVYDIIFDTRDLSKFIEQKTIIKFAYNFRVIFHTNLSKGHHSHCLIEVIGQIPEIFNELPQNGKGEHHGIGLCTQYDWQFIKQRQNYL